MDSPYKIIIIFSMRDEILRKPHVDSLYANPYTSKAVKHGVSCKIILIPVLFIYRISTDYYVNYESSFDLKHVRIKIWIRYMPYTNISVFALSYLKHSVLSSRTVLSWRSGICRTGSQQACCCCYWPIEMK